MSLKNIRNNQDIGRVLIYDDEFISIEQKFLTIFVFQKYVDS